MKIRKIIISIFVVVFYVNTAFSLLALAPNSSIEDIGGNAENTPVFPADTIISSGELIAAENLKELIFKKTGRLVNDLYIEKWLTAMEQSRQVFRFYKEVDGEIREYYEVNDPFTVKNQVKIKVDSDQGFFIGRVDSKDRDNPLFKDNILKEDSPYLYFEEIFRSFKIHEKKVRALKAGNNSAKGSDLFNELYSYVMDNYYENSKHREFVMRGLKVAARMARYNSTYSGVISGFLSVFSPAMRDEMIGYLETKQVNVSKLKQKLNLSEQIMTFPFTFDEKNLSGFQNYLLMLVQLCKTKKGLVDPDIPLIALGRLIEVSMNKRTKKFSKQYKKILSDALSFSQMLGLHDVAEEIQNIIFTNEEPEHSKIFNSMLDDYYGMSYSDLNEYKRNFIKPRIDKAMADIHGVNFKLKSRIKTPYSLWKKMHKRAVEFTGKEFDINDREQFDKILDKLDDIFGFQVVFDFSSQYWEESIGKQDKLLLDEQKKELTETKLVDKQLQIIERIKSEFAENKDISFPSREKWHCQYGYQEFKVMPSWLKGEKLISAEIQVLSDKDYSIYRYGKKAHWIYKLQNQGHHFNLKLLDRLQNILQGSYRSDFIKLFREISEDTYYRVLDTKDGNNNIYYLRTPKRSIATDAAVSRRVKAFNGEYRGAYKAELQKDFKSKYVLVEKNDTDFIETGECIAFSDNDQRSAVFDDPKRLEVILNNSKKLRAHLFAQLHLHGIEYGDHKIKAEGKASLNKYIGNLNHLTAYYKLNRTDIGKLKSAMSKIDEELTDFLWLDNREELYTIIYLINHLPVKQNEKLIKHIGEHFLRERLNMDIDLNSVQELREILEAPETELNQGMIVRLLSAKSMGKLLLEKRFKTAMPLRHFNEKSLDGMLRVKLKYAAQSLGLESYSQLATKVGLGLVSPETIDMLFAKADKFFFDLEIKIDENSQEVDNIILSALEDLNIDYTLEEGFNKTDDYFRLKVSIPSVDGYSNNLYIPDSTLVNRVKHLMEDIEGVRSVEGLMNSYYNKAIEIKIKSGNQKSFILKRELVDILPQNLFSRINSYNTAKGKTAYNVNIPSSMTPYIYKKLITNLLIEKHPDWEIGEISRLISVKNSSSVLGPIIDLAA